MPFQQKNRLLSLDTPLGSDVLLVRGFSGWEAISAPFQLDLDVVSENDAIDLRSMLGGNITLHIALTGESTRHWNGRVSKITQSSRDPLFTSYRVEVVPWLSFLRLRQDCRIFQDKTVQEIATEVFSALSVSNFDFRLHGDQQKREYCVQYRETDFHFVSRLFEEEGIFYFFEHESGSHTMVLANTPEAHASCKGQAAVSCLPSPGGLLEDDVVTAWHRNEEFQTSSVAITDYNFQTPSTQLLVSLDGNGPYSAFDYPGIYQQKGSGESLARIRLQEISTEGSVIEADSSCRAFASGFRFQLKDHYRKDWNGDYVLTEIHHTGTQGSDYHSQSVGEAEAESAYRNHFKCIPLSVPFRPRRGTERPIMMGCQTAVVAGPAGEEIYTDQFGRIKVQFHWDRVGKKNEQSSCWIRVAQYWAGKNWGSIAIPRIGQEVIVDFLEGNPDRPIITGSVYNADQMPPYTLPGGANNMGFKSKSVHGDGYNEISINDTNSTEGIIIHAQHDMNTTVVHDQKAIVKSNKNLHVAKEMRTQVDQKVSHTINGDLAEHFTKNHAEVVTNERYLKAARIIVEADQEICLKVGENHVCISSAGVYVEGQMVDLNCGHPAPNTSLSGLTPTTPDEPA